MLNKFPSKIYIFGFLSLFVLIGILIGFTNLTVHSVEGSNDKSGVVQTENDYVRRLQFSANDIIYNPQDQTIYASQPSSIGSGGNSIARINPLNGELMSSVFVGSEPGKMAISSDASTIYVILNGAFGIRRFNTATQTAGMQFSVGSVNNEFCGASDIAIVPNNPDVLAVARANYNSMPSGEGVAVYNNGVRLPNTGPGHSAGANYLAFSNSASILYGGGDSEGLRTMTVNANGVTVQSVSNAFYVGRIKYDNGILYTSEGKSIDASTGQLRGTFSGADSKAFMPDSSIGRVFYAVKDSATNSVTLQAYDINTFVRLGNLTIPNVTGNPVALIRYKSNGLALQTSDNQLFLIQTSLIPTNDPLPVPTSTPPMPTPTVEPYIPTFVRQITLPVNDLVYSSAAQSLYVSVPGSGGNDRANTLTKINPLTGALDSSVFIGSEPGLMAISSDGQTIYTKLDGSSAIRRFDIPTQTPGLQFTPEMSVSNVLDMNVQPGNSQMLAIAGRNGRPEVYNNGVKLPSTWTDNSINYAGAIEFTDASTIYGYDSQSSGFGLAKFTIANNAVSGLNLARYIISGFNVQMKQANGLLYTTSGRVVNPAAQNVLGTFPNGGTALTIDSDIKRAFYINGNVLSVFDTETFLKVASFRIPNVSGEPTSLVRWGENGLAFRTTSSNSGVPGSVYILQSALISPNPPIPTGIQMESSAFTSAENLSGLNVKVVRTGDLSETATIDYTTVDGTALAGIDYEATAGTLVFVPGEAVKTVSVPIIDDNAYEGTETFGFALSNLTGNNVSLLYPSNSALTITDNETRPLISFDFVTVTEPVVGATARATFVVRLSTPSVQTVSVDYITSSQSAEAGSDFIAASGTLTFAPLETTKTVSVQILGDNENEDSEFFSLDLFNPINGTVSVFQNGAIILNYNPQTARHAAFDFDGDGRADVSVFRPSDRVWHLNQSQAGYASLQFGFSTDKLVPADYDGDGKTDVAVYRDGIWHLLKSSLGYTSVQFGLAGDIPLPGDYDGDGFADIAVWRPSERFWYIWNSSSGSVSIIQFGLSTDKPVAADYDGDGKMDIAVYRDGTWYVQGSAVGFNSAQFGIASDLPVQADYDGDRKADLAVYRQGVWYIVLSSTNEVRIQQFGLVNDKPAVGDYDGDGKSDLAVFREGVWYLFQSTNGVVITQFGLSNDLPVPNTFVP